MTLGKMIRVRGLAALFFFAALFPAAAVAGKGAVAEKGKVVWDYWSLMKMAGDETGWVHTKTLDLGEGAAPGRYKTTTATKMEMKRFGQAISISAEGWSLEDGDGRLVALHQKNLMSGTETLYDVVVKGGEARLTVTTMGTPRPSTIPWSSDVLGTKGIFDLRREKGFAPGTKYSFKQFMVDYTKVVTVSVTVVGKEETDLLDGEKATLFHAVNTMDLLPGVKMNEWWNEKGETIKTSMDMMGITIETYLTTEQRAKGSGGKGGGLKADMIMKTMARSNVNLPNPYRLDSILYRFEAKDPDVGLPGNLDDVRQKVIESDGKTARVLIRAVTPEESQTRPIKNPPFELAEYLEPNAFLQCDDPDLKAKALEVAGKEKNAWKAACLLEHFVYEYITDKNFGTGFASAKEVFQSRSGDCSEHAVLLAALCRAAGIPARVAMGYMYLGGIFGGHMWAEVWIKGKWYAVDGVMGIGRVDPTHITFTTSSLKGGGLGESFARAVQGLGNLKITILEFTRGAKTVEVGSHFKDYVIDGNRYTNILYGVGITKPADYEFADYERDFSKLSFTLVKLEGKTDIEVNALPAAFSFTFDHFRKQLEARGIGEIEEIARRIKGRDGRLYTGKKKGKTLRILAFLDQETCYTLVMEVEDEERDVPVFERVAQSITFK